MCQPCFPSPEKQNKYSGDTLGHWDFSVRELHFKIFICARLFFMSVIEYRSPKKKKKKGRGKCYLTDPQGFYALHTE